MGRADLFPADRGLQTRILLAAVGTPLFVAACLTALALTLPAKILAGLAGVTALGLLMALSDRRRFEDARTLTVEEAPELHAMLERLCVLGDLAKPELVLDAERQPNSWLIDVPGRRPRLHVTQGLLDALDAAELEAVLAHELAHVANRDATVMTVVGTPGTAMLGGARSLASIGFVPVQLGALLAAAVGLVAGTGATALSRYRELAADAAAVRMTGRPSALASALMKVSGELQLVPADDLRAAAGRNAFNLLPVEVERGTTARWLLRRRPIAALASTHPSVEQRVAHLARVERDLQHARRRYDPGA